MCGWVGGFACLATVWISESLVSGPGGLLLGVSGLFVSGIFGFSERASRDSVTVDFALLLLLLLLIVISDCHTAVSMVLITAKFA